MDHISGLYEKHSYEQHHGYIFCVLALYIRVTFDNSDHKKVLLRERKRHTARRVVSTPSVVLPGYPPPSRVPPHPDLAGGYPVRYPPGGYPVRYPPGGVPSQVPPRGGTQSGTPPGGYPVRYPLGVPSQVPPRGVPGQVPPGGTRSGTPPGGTQSGTPQGGTWSGAPPGGYLTGYPPARVPPPAGPFRVPPAAPWHSGKCCKALWDMGTPPRCGQTNKVKLLPSRRTTYAGGKNRLVTKMTYWVRCCGLCIFFLSF